MAQSSGNSGTTDTADSVPLSLETIRRIDRAFASYKAAPNAHTLLSLNKAAIPLMVVVPQSRPWRQVSLAQEDSLACDFTAIRVVVDTRLSDEDVLRLAGCLAYALKATLAGEELGEASARFTESSDADDEEGYVFTLIEFAYRAESSTRTQPDARRAFEVAREYILQGSPLRTTDREGVGTKNTRLVNGINVPANLTFYVR